MAQKVNALKQRRNKPEQNEKSQQTSLHEETDDNNTLDYPTSDLSNQSLIQLMRQGKIQPARDLPHHKLGNRATIQLLRQGVIQLGRRRGKKPNRSSNTTNTGSTGPTLSQEEIKKRIRAGQKRRAEEKAAQNSWGSWFASWVPGMSYSGPTQEEDDGDDEGTTVYENEGGGFVAEQEFGQQEEEKPKEFTNPFDIKELEIDLGEAKMEQKGTALGNVKASGKKSLSGGGDTTYSGKASTEGAYGKADSEGKIKLSPDNLEGEGKMGFLLGASSETKSGTLGWGFQESILEGQGKMETKVGLDGELGGKLAYNSSTGDFGSEGKIGAMLGAKAESTVTIKIKSSGKDIGSTEGKIGIAYGVGGELSGKIEWKGGKFTFAHQGKLIAGIGFSYGYKLTVDSNALIQSVPGWLPALKYWLWDAWELPDDYDEDDIIIF